ncbi:ABC transporter ATP-binding protein [Fictibacillus phosphorivorans]|uniref:ABC transporter ATP-binding protein n=1 Tax=Fictibacillus phosphorivorans TaxID=1221500 RepID=UPI00203D080A|nr:ABC transporter transmembrane domain-containing protein [Fictibacillus phosphorivorans]MCM3717533.1 ABC transporter transmembrane domain-containing protein [Fictibacillus phosphorivorans]MCM3775228.1 ABC transporter transmembrane domain-containing protein [Fictibacillus phosphorivorans]
MFSVLGKLAWFFKRHWIRYTVAVVLLTVVGIIEIIPPKLIGNTIDSIHMGTITRADMMKTLGIFVAVLVSMYVTMYIWMYQLFGGAFIIERTMRSRFMRHLLKMTPTFFEKNRTGDLMARATNDLKAISMTAGFGILTLVDSSLFMLTILFVMGFMISWKLTFAALIPLPIIAFIIKKYGKKVHQRFTVAQDAFGEMNDSVLESIQGVRVIRAYVQEEADVERFNKVTEDVFEKNLAVSRIDALFEPTIKILVGLSYLIGLGYGAYMVFHNTITLGELVTFNVYLGMLIWPMIAVGELINVMERGSASLDRVNETLAYEADVKNGEDLVPLSDPGTIKFEDVTFKYPSSESDNLKGINVTVKKGETLGIVGRTGSGKTTLLKQLLREYPVGEGKISFSGVDIEDIALEDLQGWIGYVPQDAILFSKTVKENILFGNQFADTDKLNHVMEMASFKNDVNYLPEGLDTLVGEKGVALSGGQKQRVSIARALCVDPEILILDDALSAVDAKTETAIIRNIRKERAGKTTFITTHRLSAVEHADWIIVIEDGMIVDEGKHEDLIARDGWYKEQHERQQIEQNLNDNKAV